MKETITNEQKIILFEEGIPGFETLTQFVLTEGEDGVFYYLQSVETPQIIFPLVDPYLLKPDYAPHIKEGYFEKIGGGKSENFVLYAIATISGSIEMATVNLQAPLLIQADACKGIQVIVEDSYYKTRELMMALLQERGA